MKNFSLTKILFLFLLLPSWVFAADGEEFDSLVELSDKDALMFAKAICESEQECRYGVDEEPYGPFVEFSKGYFWFYKVIYGKFSQGEMSEAFIHVFESNEGEPYGNGFLFRYQNDHWSYITLGERPWGNCGKLGGYLGKEFIICYWDVATTIRDPYDHDSADGSGFVMSWFSIKGNVVERKEFIGFSNSFSVFCDDRAKYLPAPYYEFLGLLQTDTDANGYMDLELKISTTQFDTKHCYNRETGILQQSNNPVFHQLIWLFDGETFTPTPETQTFLNNLPKQ
jgi:hypothetical protein